jgi:CBS domain-containing protein
MEEIRLKGDEAYYDALAAGRRKVIDNRTFKQPIRSIGMRACVILGENESVSAAIEAMRAAQIGSVLVTGPAGQLVGIFTERDALNRLALGEKDPKKTRLQELMHPQPETLTQDDDIGYALRLMSHGGYRRIPLVDREGRPVGVVSVRDIVDFIADHFPDDILTLPTDPRSTIAKKPEGA